MLSFILTPNSLVANLYLYSKTDYNPLNYSLLFFDEN